MVDVSDMSESEIREKADKMRTLSDNQVKKIRGKIRAYNQDQRDMSEELGQETHTVDMDNIDRYSESVDVIADESIGNFWTVFDSISIEREYTHPDAGDVGISRQVSYDGDEDTLTKYYLVRDGSREADVTSFDEALDKFENALVGMWI